MKEYIVSLKNVGMGDVERVGGKNASLGEMIQHLDAAGVLVPTGFATTAEAFRDFLDQDGLADKIRSLLEPLDVNDLAKLSAVGKTIRDAITAAPFSLELHSQIEHAVLEMESDNNGGEFSVAVRSSATAEDLPTASFAGQQETYLNVSGLKEIVKRIKDVYASLFNDRAISYRVHHGFAHHEVALSAGIQKMVRSDIGSSGVMFSLDTESGFKDVVFVTSSYGLGEMVVQGAVNPDEFYVYKKGIIAGKRSVLGGTLVGKKQQRTNAETGP